MLRDFDDAIDGVVRRVGYDAYSLCERIGSIADEDDFTSRLAEDIERSLDNTLIGGVHFTAFTKKLTWRGAKAEERALGADLMLVLRMKAGIFDVSKGYLVQAKMNAGSLFEISVKAPRDLSGQIDAMLKVTSESYVWAYSDKGIAVARAGSFQAALSAGLEKEFEPQTFTAFFRAGLRSCSGDYKFKARNLADLAAMAENYRAKTFLLLNGEALPEPRRREPS
jgi:hypothetical protein